MNEQSKYRGMVDSGATAKQVYLAAKADGLGQIELIKLIRWLFGLSLVEAKEVTVVADGLASSLSEYQERLIPVFQALEVLVVKEERDGQVEEWRFAHDVWVWCRQCERVYPADQFTLQMGRDDQRFECPYSDCHGDYFEDGYNYAQMRAHTQLEWPEVPEQGAKYKLAD
jgi:hypothetical protein